jgi:hypothetical protein
MSNSRAVRRRLNRSTRVLLGRAFAELQEQGHGGYLAQVRHDDNCPGLTAQSMLRCTCMPKINIAKVTR